MKGSSRSRNVILVVIALAALVASVLAVSGCGTSAMKLGTTTGLQQSGVLAQIIPGFEKQYNIKVTVVARQTAAEVIGMGERGDVDVLLVNSRDGVKALVDKGLGVEDKDIMYADMVIVGPAADPAQIKGLDCPGKSSKKIAAAGATYVCKGDSSDLNNKIMGYWKKNNIDPTGQAWFVVTKKPTGQTLEVASDKQGYMIVDRLTWLKSKNNLSLVQLVQGCTMLYDQYTAVVVNPAKHQDKDLNAKAAEQFAGYLAGAGTQETIGSFKKYGEVLFWANAPKVGGACSTQSTTPSSSAASVPGMN